MNKKRNDKGSRFGLSYASHKAEVTNKESTGYIKALCYMRCNASCLKKPTGQNLLLLAT